MKTNHPTPLPTFIRGEDLPVPSELYPAPWKLMTDHDLPGSLPGCTGLFDGLGRRFASFHSLDPSIRDAVKAANSTLPGGAPRPNPVKVPPCPVCGGALPVTEEMTKAHERTSTLPFGPSVNCTQCPAKIGLTHYWNHKDVWDAEETFSACVIYKTPPTEEEVAKYRAWCAMRDRLVTITIPYGALDEIERILGSHHNEPNIDNIAHGPARCADYIGFKPDQNTMHSIHYILDQIVLAWKRGFAKEEGSE